MCCNLVPLTACIVSNWGSRYSARKYRALQHVRMYILLIDALSFLPFSGTGPISTYSKGLIKHQLPGLVTRLRCNPRGIQHAKGFDNSYPCNKVLKPRTRDQLLRCLPKTEHECAQLGRSRDPAIER